MSQTLVHSIENGDSLAKNVINSYFENKRVLVQHQLDSFNHFIDHKIPEILEEYNASNKNIIYAEYDKDLEKHRLEYQIKFGKIYISKPVLQENQTIVRQMFPNDARMQNLNYCSALKVDIYHKLIEYIGSEGIRRETEFTPLREHPIGKIPIMLQSKYCVLSDVSNKTRSAMGECNYDYGGYFIINGNEKVIIMQERKADNMLLFFKLGKGASKYSHRCEISSVNESNPFAVKNTEIKLTAKEGNIGRTFKVKIQGMRQELPLFVVFRALGIISDKEICETILYNLSNDDSQIYLEYLRASMEESAPIQSMQTALEYASKYVIISTSQKTFQNNKYKLWYTQDIIRDEFLPHVGRDMKKKGFFLGYMVNKLIFSILNDQYDDRDSFMNKRVDTSGELLAYLFRANFRKMMRDVENHARTELQKNRKDDLASGLSKKIKKATIESGINYGLSTGNWGLKNQKNRKGIAQVLNRLSYLGFLSHLRRVQAPFNKTLKNTDPRRLHNTQWGIICPAETPEGQSIGVVKNLSLGANVTLPQSSFPVRSLLQELEIRMLNDVSPNEIFDHCKILVNGDWVGINSNPDFITKELKKARRSGQINVFTSIGWNVIDNQIAIFTDGGRLCRPLFIVEDNKLKITGKIIEKLKSGEMKWQDLIVDKNGESYIEYIDKHEEDSCMIAMNKVNLKKTKEKMKYFTSIPIVKSILLLLWVQFAV